LLNSYIDPDFIPVVAFAENSTLTKRDYLGLEISLDEDELRQQAFAYHKFYGKGQVYHLQPQTTWDPTYYPWFFNSLFLAMGKQVILDTSLVGNPVPALESNIIVGATVSLTNLYSLLLTNFSFIAQ
jgi:hypothetical protein